MRRIWLTLLACLFTTNAFAQVSMAGSGSSVGVLVNPTLLRSLSNGTAGAPAISWTSNAADGFYWLSTGSIVFSSNGNPSIRMGGNSNGTLISSADAYAWADGTNPATGTADLLLNRDGAAGTLAVRSGASATTVRVGPTAGYVTINSASLITPGSGTGITVNDAGNLRTQVYKVTIGTTAIVCAAVTCDVTIATLPAKTFLLHALADVTVQFACTATCTSSTLSATLGKTAGGNQYLVSFDIDAATAQFGDAGAELGASLIEATIPTGIGDLASWAGTTAIIARFTSGTGNFGNGAATNLSGGSVTFYLVVTQFP